MGIDVSENGWDSDMLCYPHVFKCDGKIYLLYNEMNLGVLGLVTCVEASDEAIAVAKKN